MSISEIRKLHTHVSAITQIHVQIITRDCGGCEEVHTCCNSDISNTRGGVLTCRPLVRQLTYFARGGRGNHGIFLSPPPPIHPTTTGVRSCGRQPRLLLWPIYIVVRVTSSLPSPHPTPVPRTTCKTAQIAQEK